MSTTPITVSSENPQNEKLEVLKNLFPEAFSEGKLSTNILARILGEGSISSEKESYGMTWAGKSNARKQILTPTTKTLIPDESASVDYKTTENILIEGDNLEVLKLLQKGYTKQVKMIYIDPPYNTGKDFVYRDNFTSDKTEYEESTGQRDSAGNRLVQNTETNGRYHSDWLSMMYPRLHLARNLLRDDGVIFVSIDDHEVHNLRKILDEIYGEENFVACFPWKRSSGANDSKEFFRAINHEYVLCYAKSLAFNFFGFDKGFENYANPDYDARGVWTRGDLTCNKTAGERPNLYYSITDPETGIKYECNPNAVWRFSPETMEKHIQSGKVIFPKNLSKIPAYKRHLSEVQSETKPLSTWTVGMRENIIDDEAIELQFPLNTVGTKELKELLQGNIFSYPKSSLLAKAFLRQCTKDNDLILDFFAGSGTTGHAVMALNAEEKAEAVKNGTNPDEVGNRRYICVQLPEETDEKSEAYKAGYKKISEITAERLRRAGTKIQEENPAISLDTGFRLYRLEDSCYRIGSVEYRSEDSQYTLESLEKAIQSGLSPLREGVREADVMVEVLLKEGFPLTSVWDKVKIGENTFLHTENAGKQLYMSFEGTIAMTTIQSLGKDRSEAIFVVYDKALDDSRKVMLASRVKLRTI